MAVAFYSVIDSIRALSLPRLLELIRKAAGEGFESRGRIDEDFATDDLIVRFRLRKNVAREILLDRYGTQDYNYSQPYEPLPPPTTEPQQTEGGHMSTLNSYTNAILLLNPACRAMKGIFETDAAADKPATDAPAS